MEQNKPNRRVMMTKILLKDSLVQLIQEQHISKISVTALCNLADINRSTFYTHYSDQYELLHEIEQEAIDGLKSYLKQNIPDDRKPISLNVLIQMLQHIKENAEMFKALLSENCESSFQNNIFQLSQVLSSQRDSRVKGRIGEYLDLFGIRGAVSMLNKWLTDGMPESPEKMAEIIMQVIYHGMLSF